MMTSMLWSGLEVGVVGGGVYHVFASRILVPQVPWERQLLVDSVVFLTDPPHGAHGGAEILATGG